jgi:hypothetical protein
MAVAISILQQSGCGAEDGLHQEFTTLWLPRNGGGLLFLR